MNTTKLYAFLTVLSKIPDYCVNFLRNHLGNISAHSLGWTAIIMLHVSTVPTLLGLLTGISDKMPNSDIMLFVWAALTLTFLKSLIEKNYLYLATICAGFVAQTVLMGLILFK